MQRILMSDFMFNQFYWSLFQHQSIATSAMSYEASVFTSMAKHPVSGNIEDAFLTFDILIFSYHLILFDAAYFDVRVTA